ncbi:MAG: site-specific integrase [Desulfobulbus sp.]|jgi:integrase|uniref:tyrosine-type recombinase/integrase n=1 Tax=Desulfobulbus sp. TaxID=895 RepID=UPI00284FCA9B|nr:site-specific integrase [Desulfobulbus sp.]MDR2548737.1 site-specific integrase [Desulfobulbus sp.]
MPYRNFNKNKDKFPWLGQVVVNGKQKRKQFSSKQAALKWEVEEKERLLSRESQGPIPTVCLYDWATSYLDYAKARHAEKTYEEKRFVFREFFKSIPARLDVKLLAPNDVRLFLETQAEQRSGNAANKQRKNLKAAWRWGVRFFGLPRDNPFDLVQRFAEVRSQRAVPTLEDFWRVYEVAESYQDKLMLLFCLHTGARRDEVFRLLWKDVNFSSRKVCLRTRKNELGEWKAFWLPLTTDLERMLCEHKRTTGLLRYVFLNQCDIDQQKWVPFLYRQHWLKRLCFRAGVQQFGFHGIRHLFASILAGKNVPLVEIQKMLRHGSVTTTARYIHSLDSDNREVLDVLPGLSDSTNKNALKAHHFQGVRISG